MLKGRLRELADCYSGESTVWDIGCDHGLLGLAFLGNPNVREIHLVDPSESVILKLQNNKQLDSYISDGKLFIHHDFGQNIKVQNENSILYIAGMGGKEIASILTAIGSNSSYPFRAVISPHKNMIELRNYLKDSCYRLEREFIVQDQGRFYQVLSLNISSGLAVTSFGEAIWSDPLAPAYRDYLLSVYASHQDPQDQAYFRFLKSLTF